MKVLPYVRLARPANLLTAVSDIWAGAALAGVLALPVVFSAARPDLLWLSLASLLLYGGGVVMNDVCDAALDAVERPERPIPSGAVSRKAAAIWGCLLLTAGVLAAFAAGTLSGVLGVAVALAALLYDSLAKPHPVFGPLAMGLCRALNLWLGMSIAGDALSRTGWVLAVPILYIGAITLISRGEVHGGSRASLRTAFFFYGIVGISVAFAAWENGRLAEASPFLLLFAGMVVPPLVRAYRNPSGPAVGRAVKAGVLSLILLNASWVAASADLRWALATALLLPVSLLIARSFQVT